MWTGARGTPLTENLDVAVAYYHYIQMTNMSAGPASAAIRPRIRNAPARSMPFLPWSIGGFCRSGMPILV